MALADLVVLGASILPDSHFATTQGFYDDFSRGLNLETSNEPGNTTGDWKRGMYSDNWCRFGLTWGSDKTYGPAQINRERQKYISPKYPHPSGWSGLSIQNGNLVQRSEPIDPNDAAEFEWAKVKGYAHTDSPTPYGGTGPFGPVQVDYKSEMISTFGRFAMSFGRFMNRSKMAAGQFGGTNLKSQRRAIFPATGWLLREQIYGSDMNGQPIAGGETMYRGAYPNGNKGFRTELDFNENFGESKTKYHQTLHRNHPRYSQTSRTVDIGYDFTLSFVDSGVDVIPHPNGGGVVGFHTNGIYTSVVPMSSEMRDPLKIYKTVDGEPYREAAPDGRPYDTLSDAERQNILVGVEGERTHANGAPEHMRYCLISNLARDGNYPMNLAWDVFNDPNNSAPPHSDVCQNEIEWIGAFPLIDENPDEFGMSRRGVPTDAEGRTSVSTGGTGSGSTPSLVVRPKRNPDVIDQPSVVAAGTYKTLVQQIPEGADVDEYTFAWSAGAGATIAGPADQQQVTILIDNDAQDDISVTCNRTP